MDGGIAEPAEPQPASPYNVVAAFAGDEAAASAVERLTAAGIPASAISRHRPGDNPDPDEIGELRAEMQDELADSWAGPAGLVMTPAQAKGAFLGTVVAGGIGTVCGLVIGLLWAAAGDSTLSGPARVVLCVFLGVIGGATVGFLAGGIQRSRQRPAEERRMTGERDHLVAVHSDQREVVERASAILRDGGADAIHFVDVRQTPLPPQAEDPRPADPSGWWWRRAGHG